MAHRGIAVTVDPSRDFGYEATVAALKDDIFELIFTLAYRFSPEPTFRLASGKMSQFYFNTKPVLFHQDGAKLIANWVLGNIVELPQPRPVAIGGLEIGAIPIACTAVALAQFPLRGFVVRKQAKTHGVGLQVEGELHPEDDVVIVDDVITTGDSTLKAIEAVRGMGCNVVAIYCLVDRPEGDHSEGFKPYEELLHPVFDLDEFLDRARRRA